MATLLNFTNLEVHSRTIRLTFFDYDVIVVVVIWPKTSNTWGQQLVMMEDVKKK